MSPGLSLSERWVRGRDRRRRVARMRLWCVECGRPSGPEARNWRLYRIEDPDEEGEEILAAYCSRCALRELGELRVKRNDAE